MYKILKSAKHFHRDHLNFHCRGSLPAFIVLEHQVQRWQIILVFLGHIVKEPAWIWVYSSFICTLPSLLIYTWIMCCFYFVWKKVMLLTKYAPTETHIKIHLLRPTTGYYPIWARHTQSTKTTLSLWQGSPHSTPYSLSGFSSEY